MEELGEDLNSDLGTDWESIQEAAEPQRSRGVADKRRLIL